MDGDGVFECWDGGLFFGWGGVGPGAEGADEGYEAGSFGLFGEGFGVVDG